MLRQILELCGGGGGGSRRWPHVGTRSPVVAPMPLELAEGRGPTRGGARGPSELGGFSHYIACRFRFRFHVETLHGEESWAGKAAWESRRPREFIRLFFYRKPVRDGSKQDLSL